MNKQDALQHFRDAGALLEGHFILTSGLRSPLYLQCAKVLMHPDRAAALCGALVRRMTDELGAGAIDLVVSPAMGGVVVGYEMGRQLGCPAIFTERVDGSFEWRRGFEISPGARVLMAEDIVTTGLSSRECIACIRERHEAWDASPSFLCLASVLGSFLYPVINGPEGGWLFGDPFRLLRRWGRDRPG